MNAITRSKGPKPVQLIKALFQCAVLFCVPGLIITFFVPSFSIELTRLNQGRVDATVFKNILFIVPIFKYTAVDLIDPQSQTIDGGLIRNGSASNTVGKITGKAEDTGVLFLKGKHGGSVEVYISPKSLDNVTDKIQNYLSGSNKSSSRLWVVSNWKFGAILPGGILLFCLVVFFMAAWSIITDKPLESATPPLQ